MNTKDLRIGNLVMMPLYQYNKKGFILTSANSIEIVTQEVIDNLYGDPSNKKAYHPIPLSSEWLEKMGMNDNPLGLVFQAIPRGGYKIYKDYVLIGEVKLVHQFQNLYFDLTGQDLKFDLKYGPIT